MMPAHARGRVTQLRVITIWGGGGGLHDAMDEEDENFAATIKQEEEEEEEGSFGSDSDRSENFQSCKHV